MKSRFLIFFLCLFYSCAGIQIPNRVSYYLDENGKAIKSREFQERWRNKENNLARWDYVTKDSSRVARLFNPVYAEYNLNYPVFKQKLEEITGKVFAEDQIFLIDYTYVNDLCAIDSSNKWDKPKVKIRKRFTNINKEKIEQDPQMLVLNFFEEGILLENSEDSEEEYFFTDKGNFLRNHLFPNSTLCGSLAVVKPNGEALVRNGEYSTLSMAQHLKEENWSLFFNRN